MKVVDPTREDAELLLQNEVVAGSPDPDGAGHVSRGDPLAVGGKSGDGGRVGMVPIDGDLKRVLKVHNNDGSAVGVEHPVGLGVAGDQNPTATLRRRHT